MSEPVIPRATAVRMELSPDVLARLRERILAFAASRVGRDSAEDLVQETMMVLVERYRELNSLSDLMPLAFQIVRFKMAGAMRKSIRRRERDAVPIDDTPIADGACGVDERLIHKQLKERLFAALERMGERCRQLFRLKLNGFSFEAIRQEMGAASVNTVYTWDLRCRQQLQEAMNRATERLQ